MMPFLQQHFYKHPHISELLKLWSTREAMQHWLLGDWVIYLTHYNFSSSINSPAHFIFLYRRVKSHCVCVHGVFLIHSSSDGRLGWFRFLDIVNRAATNRVKHTVLCVHAQEWYSWVTWQFEFSCFWESSRLTAIVVRLVNISTNSVEEFPVPILPTALVVIRILNGGHSESRWPTLGQGES